MLKGQAAVEYAFIAAIVVTVVVLVAAPVFREFELHLALENVRRECVQVAWENGVEFAQLNYSISGRTILLSPEFFYGNDSKAEVAYRQRPLNAIAAVFHAPAPEGECVNVLNYEYCLEK